ncbi:MAG: NAD(P)H-hydrate dehydratase [Eubacteriales bacterium]|nr:NAD(P)H-hydrate dehydratase [Eubacteriales bacterium]
MREVVTGGQMKDVDRDTIERIGIPSLVLMERAALAVADEVEKLAEPGARILAVCGTGNNGADGIAAGRILKGRGYEVTVVLAGNLEHASKEHRIQRQIAEKLGVQTAVASDYLPGSCEVIVDAVFGIGLGRPVEGAYAELLSLLQEKREKEGAKVVAVDIPSGIHADNGAVMGTALAADVTVTFGFWKTGLMLYPGKQYAGRVTAADIGFSRESLKQTGFDALVMEKEDLKRLPGRQPDGNKGTFGRVLVIAGSRGMSGAAYLSGLAAYRTGAGLVKILTVSENRAILQAQLPEAIVEEYRAEEVSQDAFAGFLEKQCSWADVIVVGPGLGREAYAGELVEMVLSHAYVPVVLDADGLNAVAAHPHLTRYFTENIIITPHIGEMVRLCGCTAAELKADPLGAARAYAGRHGAVCVMKDAVTVTADKDGGAWINESGCSAMAKAGSGDVLTGVIGGLLARGMDCAEAACLGVYIHGLAGECAAEKYGTNSILAGDLADCLGEVL